MRVHRLIEHVPVGSNRLQALFLSDDLALTASDFELPVTRDIAEVLGKMPGATLLARDLDHDLGGLAHDPLELGPRLGRRQHQPPRRRAPSNPSWGTRTADAVESPTPRRGPSNPSWGTRTFDASAGREPCLRFHPLIGNKNAFQPEIGRAHV